MTIDLVEEKLIRHISVLDLTMVNATRCMQLHDKSQQIRLRNDSPVLFVMQFLFCRNRFCIDSCKSQVVGGNQ